MADRRFGVLGRVANSAGELMLILPDDSVEFVSATATEDELAVRYGLQEIVRTLKIDFCMGICLDGPRAGEDCYAVNELGYQVQVTTGGQHFRYEVVRLTDGARPAELRFLGARPRDPGAHEE